MDRNCISAHTVPNTPYTLAAPAVSPPRKSSIRCGSTGMIIPSANMSRTMVTKMKASAARRRPPSGTVACMAGSAVLQHRARLELGAAETRRDADVEQHADAAQCVAGLAAQRGRGRQRAAGREHVVDQQQTAATGLHLEHAGAVFEVVGDVDHRRRQLALLADGDEALVAPLRE